MHHVAVIILAIIVTAAGMKSTIFTTSFEIAAHGGDYRLHLICLTLFSLRCIVLHINFSHRKRIGKNMVSGGSGFLHPESVRPEGDAFSMIELPHELIVEQPQRLYTA